MHNLIYSEIKVFGKIFILSIIVATGIFSVAIIFCNLTNCIMPAVINQYDMQLESGLAVNISNIEPKDIKLIEKYGAYNININIGMSNNLQKSCISLDNSQSIEGNPVSYQHLTLPTKLEV